MNARKKAPQLFKPNHNPAPSAVPPKLANIKEATDNGPIASISFSRQYIRPAENIEHEIHIIINIVEEPQPHISRVQQTANNSDSRKCFASLIATFL